jgi:hypothetical protein
MEEILTRVGLRKGGFQGPLPFGRPRIIHGRSSDAAEFEMLVRRTRSS